MNFYIMADLHAGIGSLKETLAKKDCQIIINGDLLNGRGPKADRIVGVYYDVTYGRHGATTRDLAKAINDQLDIKVELAELNKAVAARDKWGCESFEDFMKLSKKHPDSGFFLAAIAEMFDDISIALRRDYDDVNEETKQLLCRHKNRVWLVEGNHEYAPYYCYRASGRPDQEAKIEHLPSELPIIEYWQNVGGGVLCIGWSFLQHPVITQGFINAMRETRHVVCHMPASRFLPTLQEAGYCPPVVRGEELAMAKWLDETLKKYARPSTTVWSGHFHAAPEQYTLSCEKGVHGVMLAPGVIKRMKV